MILPIFPFQAGSTTTLASGCMGIAMFSFMPRRRKEMPLKDLFAARTLFMYFIAERSMKFCMCMYRNYLQILNGIVQFISIYVVNMFGIQQLTSKILFHYQSMFAVMFSIFGKILVSTFINIPRSSLSSYGEKRITITVVSLPMKLAKTLTVVRSLASLYFTSPLSRIVWRIHTQTVSLNGAIRKGLLSVSTHSPSLIYG